MNKELPLMMRSRESKEKADTAEINDNENGSFDRNATEEKALSLMPFEAEELSQEDLNATQYYGGMAFPPAVRSEALQALNSFEIRSDDILIITYPKNGTHWMMEIVGLLLADGCPEKMNRRTTLAHLEFILVDKDSLETTETVKHCYMYKILETSVSPRIISTHLRERFLPAQVFKKNPKIIYVARNPKDVFTSYYLFMQKDPRYGGEPWESYFNAAITGDYVYGSWFDHVLEYWNMRDRDNVLYMKYEDMKKDPRTAVKKVASHLNLSSSEDMIDRVVGYTTVDEMKKTLKRLETETKHKYGANYGKAYGINSFVRKGIVGDWKNYFTVAQSEEFDKVFKEKMAESNLTFELV